MDWRPEHADPFDFRRYRCVHLEDFFLFSSIVRGVPIDNENVEVGPTLWRGQSDPAWPLTSPLERTLGEDKAAQIQAKRRLGDDGWTGLCYRNMSAFLHDEEGRVAQDEDLSDPERWARGRHFGLNSPLLDWSFSPFVALFFAFSDHFRQYEAGRPISMGQPADGYVTVWEILSPLLVTDDSLRLYLTHEYPTPRATAQRSAFTEIRTSQVTDLVDYFIGVGQGWRIGRYMIPVRLAPVAYRYLDLMNIRFRTMYPDAEGKARQANMTDEHVALSLVAEHKRGIAVHPAPFSWLPLGNDESGEASEP